MANKRAISILSAGLDSTVATMLAAKKYEITCAITFDYGQRAAKREISLAKKFCKTHGIEHTVIKLDWMKAFSTSSLVDTSIELPKRTKDNVDKKAKASAKSVWVPNRNAVFISIAASMAEARSINAIVTGFNAEEAKTFPDNSKAYLKAQNEALSFSTLSKVKVISPTIGMEKSEIAAQFIKLNLDRSTIWSCYEGKITPCGICESCVRTKRAFDIANRNVR